MNVKEAVSTARSWVSDVLQDEQIVNLGLEEVKFDEAERVWRITVGFSRPWNSSKGALSAITGEQIAKRAYKVISVRDADGEVISMTQREAV